MFKKSIILFILLNFILTGCSNTTNQADLTSNPFISNESGDGNIPISYGISINNLNTDKNLFEYHGEPITIEFLLQNGPVECEVGIIILIDGIIQSYQPLENEKKETTIQPYKLNKNESKIVKIQFTPSFGTKGDQLKLQFLCMINPSFTPKSNNQNYENNHKFSQLVPQKLLMCLNAPTNNDITFSQEFETASIPSDTLEEYIKKDNNGNIVKNTLDKNSYIYFYENNNKSSNIYINNENYKEIEMRIFGGNSTKYRLSLFLNHKQIDFCDNQKYLDIVVEKGNFASKKFNLKTTDFNKYNHLYIIATPLSDDFSSKAPLVFKSDSITIIKIK